MKMRWKRYILCGVAGMLAVALAGCGQQPVNTRVESTTEIVNAGWNGGKATTTQETQPEAPKAESYTATSVIDGSVLQAELGKNSYIVSEQKYVRVRENCSVLLPDLAAWSGGTIRASSVSEENGRKSQYFFADNSLDLAVAEEYLNLLACEYGVTYSEPDGISDVGSSYTVWTLNFPEGTGEMSRYTSLSSNFISLEYPSTIGLVDTGARQGGGSESVEDIHVESNTVLADYERNKDGYDVFTSKGWDSNERIEIYLFPSEYKTGDVFTLEDFKAQADAGSSAIIRCFVTSERVFDTAFSLSPVDSYADRYTEVKVEILDKSETQIVIYYYFLMNDVSGNLYAYEGIMAVERETAGSSGETETDGSNDIPAYTGSDRCTYCQGRGYEIGNCVRCHGSGKVDCTYCMGGLIDCTKCGGRGTIYDMVSNSETECFTCHHSGKVDCWKCNGSGSQICTNCNGKGHAQCIHCHGSGKK